MDRLTPEQRHKNMVAIKSKGTRPEKVLAEAMWSAGLRYRKNDASVFGHPDFVHKGKKIAIFVDGDMWHGKNWDIQKDNFKSNREFWIPKIESNMARDLKVTEKLIAEGWTVLRFWESDVKTDSNRCIQKVKEIYLTK